MKQKLTSLSLICLLILCLGCTPRYIISQHLVDPLPESKSLTVAEMKDDLPPGKAADKRPSAEQVEKFRKFIVEALENRGVFLSQADGSGTRYEVTATLRDFEKGSGVGRFLLGGGVGFDGEMSVRIQLVNTSTNEVVFAGDFKAKAQGWAETSGDSFRKIAIDFANSLKKDMKKLSKK